MNIKSTEKNQTECNPFDSLRPAKKMNLFTENKDFWPTTENLIIRMWNKISKQDRQQVKYILEPQAGAGNIIEYIKSQRRYSSTKIHAIEKDPQLQALLRGKNINVIDSDFLTFSGSDKYDLIIGNPPFSSGDLHLLKAIDILYSGHIVYLINAETLKNPYTNTRKLLVKKLEELNAEIEYLKNAFVDAERKTGVEVALIHIHIKRDIGNDLFEGVSCSSYEINEEAQEHKELTQKDSIVNLVADYNRIVKIGTQSLLDFYKNFHSLSKYLHINVVGEEDDDRRNLNDLTKIMKQSLNDYLVNVRKDYWGKVLNFDKVKARMTVKKLKEFNKNLQDNAYMDFTESNISTFILNLINGYEDILREAVQDMFETLTTKHAYDEELHIKNTHYFDGWKTNKAYRVNKKIVIPFYRSDSFIGWCGEWSLSYSIKDQLNDFDKVANYFDGRSDYISIVDAIEKAYTRGQSRKILSTYFEITTYKKGTMHLTFRSDDILRRFNITACQGKNWLPEDYGQKKYESYRNIVDTFENKKIYEHNISPNKSLFITKNLLQIAA